MEKRKVSIRFAGRLVTDALQNTTYGVPVASTRFTALLDQLVADTGAFVTRALRSAFGTG